MFDAVVDHHRRTPGFANLWWTRKSPSKRVLATFYQTSSSSPNGTGQAIPPPLAIPTRCFGTRCSLTSPTIYEVEHSLRCPTATKRSCFSRESRFRLLHPRRRPSVSDHSRETCMAGVPVTVRYPRVISCPIRGDEVTVECDESLTRHLTGQDHVVVGERQWIEMHALHHRLVPVERAGRLPSGIRPTSYALPERQTRKLTRDHPGTRRVPAAAR